MSQLEREADVWGSVISGLRATFRWRWSIGVAAFALSIAVGVGYAYWWATPIYKASAVLAPVRQTEMGDGLGALLGQFGDLASLAGVGALGRGDEQNAVSILRSRAFAEIIIREADLLPHLFPSRWDPQRHQWRTNDDRGAPTADDAWLMFDKRARRVNVDQRTGVVTVEVLLPDREAATRAAALMASRINDAVRERVISEAAASRRYLENQIESTNSVEMRQALFRLVEIQLRREVLANSRAEFALVLIDPPTVPDEDKFESPRRALIVAVSVVLGLLAGFASMLLSLVVRPIPK